MEKAERKAIESDGRKIIPIREFRNTIAYTRNFGKRINCFGKTKQGKIVSLLKKTGRITLARNYIIINSKI